MIERQMLDWLEKNSLSFHIAHNPQTQHQTTVARYLLHRERLGDVFIFAGVSSRLACINSDNLWELDIEANDDLSYHFVGNDISQCLDMACENIKRTTSMAIVDCPDTYRMNIGA